MSIIASTTNFLQSPFLYSVAPIKLHAPSLYRHQFRLRSSSSSLPFNSNTQHPIIRCSTSPDLGLAQPSVEQGDPHAQILAEKAPSKQGFLFSAHGWAAFRVAHDDLDTLRQFSQVQAEAFHVPFAFFNDFFFSIFEAEVLSSLLQKIRHAAPKRFACLIAVPDCPQDAECKVVGVVDAAAMGDGHVLRCLPGVNEYLYISGMAVDPKYRRQKVATVLLQACDLTAMEWGFEYLVLQAYEDDRAARLLYAKAGYKVISIDPLWLSKWFGRRRRVILAKRATLVVS